MYEGRKLKYFEGGYYPGIDTIQRLDRGKLGTFLFWGRREEPTAIIETEDGNVGEIEIGLIQFIDELLEGIEKDYPQENNKEALSKNQTAI